MSNNKHTGFLEMFPCCEEYKGYCGGLVSSYIKETVVNNADKSIDIFAYFAQEPSGMELGNLERRIKSSYAIGDGQRLCRVTIHADFPKPVYEIPEEKGDGKASKLPTGETVFGDKIKKAPIPMAKVELGMTKVVVEGDVFDVSSKKLKKNGGAVLAFDITDRTGSYRVSRYLRPEDDQSVLDKIAVGDHVYVCGDVNESRYDRDIVIEPRHIVKGKKSVRVDDAEVKRVELHMHTRFSALDALTDPAEAVKRAAYWGMPAIAVTDHGVLQAFPDMWKAGKKNGVKIIYGLECYFVNDLDGSLALHGECGLPLNTELCAFDIETTGLNSGKDRITEIGAVIFSVDAEGKTVVKDSFNTLVNCRKHIPPEVTKLTGIRDEDLRGAPGEKKALSMFLEFAGDRPLVAHNADFDTGFIAAAAERCGAEFNPVYLDTMTLSQALLPEMKHHKLDQVSDRLSLPEFNHHRASDDALVAGRIMGRFITMLKDKGAKDIDDIQRVYSEIRPVDKGRSRHMILLVQNKKGLKNLYQMVSESYLKHFYKTPTIPKSLLIKHREGILVGSACGMGELYGAIMHGAPDRELLRIASFYDYLEIQPICNNEFLVQNEVVKDVKVLQNYNRKILELGRKLKKPVIAASDVHFLDPEDELYRKILQAAKKFSDADRGCPIYFRNTKEMLKEFEYLGEEVAKEVVITNTRAIADSVEEFELLPKELFPPKIENSAQQLTELVYGKMHAIYGEEPPEIVKSRVDTELKTILDHNYDVIYMSAQKLVQNSLEHGYLVGSRGSVGSSIVAYMSGITEVNSLPPHYVCPKCKHSEFVTDGSYGCGADMPEKDCPVCGEKLRRDGFDIPFETFLGFPGNEKTPDIDLNFSGEYQAKAHKYTEELFGSDHVFRAGTIGTLAEKTAFGYVKNYLKERDMVVTKAEENRLAKGLVGIKRTTGQHPGGLVVIPQDMDVTDFCPVQHPADDPNSDIITTHFEYHCMEDNLLKLDELGHDDPTMIKMLEDATGVDAKQISLSDPDTMKIFTTPTILGLPEDDPIIGKTGSIGVPEFGTPFTRQMLVDTKPTQFDTLVRLSGFSHGTDVWAGNIRDLIVNGVATVNETVGCRDDIMMFLISKGMEPSLAFKTMEAVRKGKVKKSGQFPGDAEKQMRELGVPEWYIESCRKIAYLFPKAHAVAYVMMAYRIAWFKVHEPLAYYSAYFYRRSQKNNFDAEKMIGDAEYIREQIKELKAKDKDDITANEDSLLTTFEAVYEFYMRGFEFAPIDLYESDATKFKITEDGRLRPPFVSIAGLGETAAYDLAKCAESNTEFLSIDEISAVCPKVSQSHFEALKRLGALGNLPDSSQTSLFDE